jgi:hypothetical protein
VVELFGLLQEAARLVMRQALRHHWSDIHASLRREPAGTTGSAGSAMQRSPVPVSPRECSILELIGRGLSTKEVSRTSSDARVCVRMCLVLRLFSTRARKDWLICTRMSARSLATQSDLKVTKCPLANLPETVRQTK